jgi:ATP-dependent Lhr-like helicase
LSSAYFGLDERLRHFIAHQMGWRTLRPIQELSIPAILSGDDCLLLAPTAGGKTEAALIPCLEMLLRRRRAGLGMLYLCPLKALLNNQLGRLEKWAQGVGMSVFLWHGDIGQAERARFLKDPDTILMTTPESLEVMLTLRQLPWQNLATVVIDEIHAFAGQERGDHLLALLERIPTQFQRIGLSATVGNPQDLLGWMQGGGQRASQLVDPGKSPRKRRVEVYSWDEEAHRHLQVSRLTASGKSLVFVDSKRKAEELGQCLSGSVLHHASLSPEQRAQSEQTFATAERGCIVATSTMELGLDVGDLDRVVQIHAPSTVASLLQRWGRSGRREQPAHLAFVTDEHWSFLQACALLRLAMSGYVEPVRLENRSMAIYAQQLLARSVAEGGCLPQQVVAPPWRDLSPEERGAIVDHLCQQGLLARADGRLILGNEAHRKLGGNYFRELYCVFASQQNFAVVASGGAKLGQLEAWFVWSMLGQSSTCFSLAGRNWTVLDFDKERQQLVVEPAPEGSLPQWQGQSRLLDFKLCQEMRSLLLEDQPLPFLASKEARLLGHLREQWQPILEDAPVNLKGNRLFTFAGGRINQVLALLWQQLDELRPTFNNFWVQLPELDDEPDEKIVALMRRLKDPQPLELESLVPQVALGKFQRFLPPFLEARYRAERLLDIPGARALAEFPWAILSQDFQTV